MIFCVFYSIIYIHFNISDENSMLLAVASSVKSGAYDKGSPAFNWSFDGARSRGPRNLGGRKRNFQVISLSLSLSLPLSSSSSCVFIITVCPTYRSIIVIANERHLHAGIIRGG